MGENSLATWVSLAEIASAFAIVITLLYVAYELKRSTFVLNSDVNQKLLDAIRSWEQLIIVNNELADIYIRGPEEYKNYSKENRLRYRLLIIQYLATWEQAFEDHKAGLINTGNWEEWNSNLSLDLGYVSVVWSEISNYIADDFRCHIELELSNLSKA